MAVDDSSPTGADKAYKEKLALILSMEAFCKDLRAMADEVEKMRCFLAARDPDFHEKYCALLEFRQEVTERANEVRGLLK